jgi:arylsulfatase A-like enzyme
VLELAGLTVPDDPLAAGESLLPLLLAGVPARRETVMVFDEYGGTRSVRGGDWKYVVRTGSGPEELYNVSSDPEERDNLATDPSYAPRREELRTVLHDWFRAHADKSRDAFTRPVSGWGQMRPGGTGSDTATYYQGDEERRVAPG